MVVVYEVHCSRCGMIFHMFTKDRSEEPADGLMCTSCVVKKRSEYKQFRTLRQDYRRAGPSEIRDWKKIFVGYDPEARIIEARIKEVSI